MQKRSARILIVLVIALALAAIPTIVMARGFTQEAPPAMTETALASIAGVLLSLAFSYIPGLDGWFAALDANKKRLVMLASLFVAALGVFGLSCASLVVYVSCTQTGAWTLVTLLFSAIVANQAAYLLTPVKA